ncbi:MAG: hypothetical protein K2X66_13030 [Cyanobacteria bacterium]|nr:hypothetical protein [Cyanobacteriota bacterium]
MFQLPFLMAKKNQAKQPTSNLLQIPHPLNEGLESAYTPRDSDFDFEESGLEAEDRIENSASQDNNPVNAPLTNPSSIDLFEDVALVAKEDIYYKKGSHTVLLMKSGQVVAVDLIPKLIKFGVTPQQFLLEKISDTLSQTETEETEVSKGKIVPPLASPSSQQIPRSGEGRPSPSAS